jgi:integrase
MKEIERIMSIEIEPTSTTGLALLTPAVRSYVESSKASNTRRAYASHWRAFEAFCNHRGLASLPTSPEAVIGFIVHQAETGKRPSTIQAQLAAIGFAHKSTEHPNPCDSIKVQTAIAGVRRKLGTRPRQKAPATLDVVRDLVVGLPNDLRGKRDRAILLTGFFGAFRRSELMALDIEDVQFTKFGARVLVQRSKTDQEGAGLMKQLPQLDDPATCPIVALREWLDTAAIQSGPLFRSIDKHGHMHSNHLQGREVARIVKRACTRAGIDPRQFAGHSLRAGFITDASEHGAQAWEISEQSGHAPGSKVLQQYIRASGRGALHAIGLITGKAGAM